MIRHTVWLVDGVTRMILPCSAWAGRVQEKLRQMGHTVQRTGLDSSTLVRDADELARLEVLLDSTGE